MKSTNWDDKHVPDGKWHKEWQRVLGHTYSVEAIKSFQSADFRLYHAEMPRERFLAMERTARQLLKVLERNKRNAKYAGSFLLDALLPVAMAEDLHASLRECYPRWLGQHGTRRARWIVNAQILRVVVGHYAYPILDGLKRLLHPSS